MIDGRHFDRQVESELNRVLGPIERGSIPAWRAPEPVHLARAAVGVKALTGVAVVVLAGAGATAAGAAVATGSMNPSAWGQKAAVCNASLRASGMTGFARCFEGTTASHSTLRSGDRPAAKSPETPGGGQTGERDKRPSPASSPSPVTQAPGGPTVNGPPLISPGPGPGASH
jgi:hypothetical protein